MKVSIKLLCASILIHGASVAYAEPAFIITEGSCGMADGDFNFFYTNDVKQVNSNNSTNGNITVKCFATGVPNSTGSVVKYNNANTGASCGTLGVVSLYTEEWKEVVDTEGNAVLTCKFRNY